MAEDDLFRSMATDSDGSQSTSGDDDFWHPRNVPSRCPGWRICDGAFGVVAEVGTTEVNRHRGVFERLKESCKRALHKIGYGA